MSNDRDIRGERKWIYQERAKIVITNLQKRNMNGQYVSTRQEALSVIMGMIPKGVTVVRGDSLTLDQVGIITALEKRNQNKVIDPYQEDASGAWVLEYEEGEKLRREAFFSDVFLAGTNAITLDGKLVNTDGNGNRVSAMIYGPKKVIIAAGVNKIVKDVNEALERIRGVAAPINAAAHYLKGHGVEYGNLPCVKTGRCVDCDHDIRICRYTTIIEGAMPQHTGRINVVLIGEELGM